MRIPRQVRFIVFDWGDTLVRPPGVTTDRARHLACTEAVFRALEADPAFAPELSERGIDWPAFRDSYLRVVARQVATTFRTGREHSFAERFRLAFEDAGLGRALTPGEMETMAADLGRAMGAACLPIEGAARAVHRLGRHYRLGLLSNFPHPATVLDTLGGFGGLFDPLIVSGACGWAKPHRNAFDACLRAFDCAPGEVLLVGDDPANDIEGGRAFGFRTCWIERPGPPPPPEAIDLRVASVMQLAELAPA